MGKGNSYGEIGECEKVCERGLGKFVGYVDERISEMQTLLNGCVENSRKLPNSLEEVYRCYDIYNKGFKQLKIYIVEESMYYE